MKNFLYFILFLCVFTITGFGQEEPVDSFPLSDEQIAELFESDEYIAMINFDNAFLDTVQAALERGVSIDELSETAKLILENPEDMSFHELLFVNVEAGIEFLENYKDAKARFIERTGLSNQYLTTLTCSECGDISEKIDFFFDKYEKIEANRGAPVCGSASKRVKMYACMALTGWTSVGAGPAAPAVMIIGAWSCWCWHCSSSWLGSLIC